MAPVTGQAQQRDVLPSRERPDGTGPTGGATAPGTASPAPGTTATAAGVLLAVVVLGLVTLSPLRALVPYAAVGATLAAGLWLERRPTCYLTLVVWVWLTAPLLRRLVDLASGYQADSPVLLAPVAAVVPGAVSALLAPARRVAPPVALALTAALLTTAYALPVGVLQSGVAAAAAGLVNWLPPLLLALWVVVRGPADEHLRPWVVSTARLGLLVVGTYGVVQWSVLPAWDAAWITGAGLESVGAAEPMELRVFSTLNSPGPCASVLVLLLVVAGGAVRRPWHLLGLLPGYAALLLTLVRSAWVGLALTAVVALVIGVLRLRALVVAGLGVALALSFGGPAAEIVEDRFTSSAEAGAEDVSASARLDFAAYAYPEVLSRPTGSGLGAGGTASRLAGATQTDPLRRPDLDSGAIEVMLTMGSIGGLAYLLTVFSAVAWLVRRLRHDRVAVCVALGAVALLGQVLLGNPFTSVTGVALWLAVAVAARLAVLQGPARA